MSRLGAILLVVGVCACAGAGEAKPAARLLIVADEAKPMEVLAGFLREPGGYDVRIVDQKDLPSDLAGFAAVFQYLHGRMTPETSKAICAYATGGGRLIALHHGIASGRRANPEFLRLAGIAIPPNDHPTAPWRVLHETTHTLVDLAPKHYITTHKVAYQRQVEYASPDVPERRGTMPAIDIPKTEVFLNQQFTDGSKRTVLFGFRCTDPDSGKAIMQDRGGWLKPAGKGWLFYLQPGHTAEDFKHPAYRQIILNCLSWQPSAKPVAADP